MIRPALLLCCCFGLAGAGQGRAGVADGARGGPRNYDAFGVFGTALQEKIGVFQASSLRVVPNTSKCIVRARCVRKLLQGAPG